MIYKPTYAPTIYAPMYFIPLLSSRPFPRRPFDRALDPVPVISPQISLDALFLERKAR